MAKKTVGNKYEYEMTNKLGSGAFAEVYKGRNRSTGEIVAIKVIKRSLLLKYGDDMLKQIHTEVSILQELVKAMRGHTCPFINKIFECMETTNNIYIVLEFCNQGTLLDKLRKQKRLPEEEAIFVLFQLTSALAFLSKNEIAHRDIKPENVFVKDGVYKLGDFGFAGQKQLYQTHLGTYPYMAPEFFNSSTYDGASVDVWALGLLFHEILFGEIFYIGNSQYEVTQKILNKPYALKPDQQASPEVRDILPRMIEKDKTKRITAIEMMEHPVFNGVKSNPLYLEIMEQERQYMEKFQWGDDVQEQVNRQSEEERQRQEQELKQKKLAEELQKQAEEERILIAQQVELIIDAINSVRNGVTLLVQLCEFLQLNFIEVCRFEIFYILKQALIQANKIKEQMDQQYAFSGKDHQKFNQIDPNVWKFFYQDIRQIKLCEDVESDRNTIRKNYIDYYNYINNYTQAYYPIHLQNLQTQTNMDLQNPIDPCLFESLMESVITFFHNELNNLPDEQYRPLIRKAILWLYVASQSQYLFNGKYSVTRLMTAFEGGDIETIKQVIAIQ